MTATPLFIYTLTLSAATQKVGEQDESISLDLCGSAFFYSGSRKSIENLTATKGDIVRCVKGANKDSIRWYLNETLLQGNVGWSVDGVNVDQFHSQLIPAFSGKGTWSITKVDLDYR